MRRLFFFLLVIGSISFRPVRFVRADDEDDTASDDSQVSDESHVEDGTHDATVTTESGSYTVPVEVSDGNVENVDWPNGGEMTLDGAELDGNEADGTNSRGEPVHVELEDQ